MGGKISYVTAHRWGCLMSWLFMAAAHGLKHGCARVAHCATTRWRNFSPLLLSPTAVWRLSYVFWAQRSTGRRADSTRCTQTRVHSARGKYIVRQWTSREGSLRHSSGWGNWSVSHQYRDLRTRGLKTTWDPWPGGYLPWTSKNLIFDCWGSMYR